MIEKKLLNLPNLLTFLRILFLPFIAVFLYYDGPAISFELDYTWRITNGRIAVIFFFFATMTDVFDGYLARKYKIESVFGKLIDPVADKLLMLVTMIILLHLDRIAPWLVIVFLGREFIVTGLRAVAAGERLIISAGWLGKYKMYFQCFGIGGLMFNGRFFGCRSVYCGDILLYIALFFSIWSLIDYTWKFTKIMKERQLLT